MKITELYLKNYGKFSEKHFYLKDGIQVIYGENEFGKSTLHAFIRAMLIINILRLCCRRREFFFLTRRLLPAFFPFFIHIHPTY